MPLCWALLPASLSRRTADSLSHIGRSVKRFCCLYTCSHLIEPRNQSETNGKMKHLAITAGLLLLVQAFHLAMLQYSTDTPRRTIDKSWLRELTKDAAKSDDAALTEEEPKYDQGVNTADDNVGEMPSGFMAENTEEEDNLARQYYNENETFDEQNTIPVTTLKIFENDTSKQPELPHVQITMTTTTTNSTKSNQTSMTGNEEFNSTMNEENSTSFQNSSDGPELQAATLAPENNAFTPSLVTDDGLTNSSGSTNTTNMATSTNATSTNATSTNATSTNATSTNTTAAPPINMTAVMPTTEALIPNTPERANKTGKGASTSDRGLEPDPYRSERSVAWVAVLGTGAAVACVGLVAYILKKKRNGFSHRKLVEEYPSDPVLRLDNNEPLDLNFAGTGAYYNPGLQGDNIQMTNFPAHR